MVNDTTCRGYEAAEDQAGRVRALQDENAQLQRAVASHAVVDQAIGVVIAVGRLTPEQAWDVLRNVSQHTNIKLRRVAELLLELARTGQLPTNIRAELKRRLDHPPPPQG
ncbi:ANTAR domain-containing protein [Streptomyces sp. YS-B37]|uniref:ANTAR domain-containing protein n=1 Tax=Streptomyces sp. YS-B37 TaxID=3407669 RepID=UPI003B5059FB